MLVLSRKEQETIVLPALSTKIQVLKVRGQNVRIGIEAPHHVQILRGEIAPAESSDRANDVDVFEENRQLRDRLDETSSAIEKVQQLLQQGEHAEARELVDQLADVAAKPQQTARPRTLLVEDNPVERKFMANVLRKSGFDVEVAGDGAEALDYLSSDERPDAVLMDMMMPRVDGPTAVEQIRETPELEGVRIYALSSRNPKELGVAEGPMGVDRWYRKPVNPQRLVDELTAELNSSD